MGTLGKSSKPHIGKGEQKEDTRKGRGRGANGTLIKKKIKFSSYIRKFKSYVTNGLLIYGEIFAHFLTD